MKYLDHLKRFTTTIATGAALLLSPTLANAAAEISVSQAGSDLSTGGAIDFGNTNLGTTTSLTFAVNNAGDSALTLGQVAVSDSQANEFSVTAQPATTLAAAGGTTFEISFTPAANGARSATLTLSNSDSDESPFTISVSGTGTSPEITVSRTDAGISSDIADGGTTSYQNVTVEQPSSLSFSIENTGTSNLTLGAASISGANSGDFTVTSQPATQVGPGTGTNMVVRFIPGGTGARSASVSFATNDTDENPFNFTLSGNGISPEITIRRSGQSIDDSNVASDLGNVVVGANASATYTVENSGSAPLTLGTVAIGGTHAGDFSITSQPATEVAIGGSTTFTVRFSPSAVGARSAAITLTNSDLDENPYDFPLSGTGLVPEITVSRNGQNIGDDTQNDRQEFGNVLVGQNQSLTFTIENTGSAPLTLGAVAAGGSHASDFTVTSQPATTVSAGNSTTFTVRFSPSADGQRNATLTFSNNDTSESPFTIYARGQGLAPQVALEITTDSGNISVAPNSNVAFPNQTVGSYGRRDFIIKNEGGATLTLGTVNVAGADFTVTEQPATSLAANSSASFTVQFFPLSAGTKSSSLTFSTNDPSRPTFIITLTSTATPPPVGSDSFGYQYTGRAVNAVQLSENDSDVFNTAELVGDDAAQTLNIGFEFFFYDKSYTSLSASTNGLITFDGPSSSYSPRPIPNTTDPDNYIAPFWTDLVQPGGKILHATRGSAPNRRFIIEYLNMGQYSNTNAKASFQVTLHEGSNKIDITFRSISPNWNWDRPWTIGIESRQNPSFGNQVGLQYDRNPGTTAFDYPAFPSAVSFTRPVVLDISREFIPPNGNAPIPINGSDDGFIPGMGIRKEAHGSTITFQAPEFIYLNAAFLRLPEVGSATETDSSKLAVYRLVNDGYAIDGQVVQGTQTFVTTTLTHDLTLVWRWRLEPAVFVDASSSLGSATINLQDGVANPAPVIGRHWVERNTDFTASIDRVAGEGILGSDIAGFRYTTQQYSVGPQGDFSQADRIDIGNDGNRVSTSSVTINDWTRIRWYLSAEVRYTFDAKQVSVEGTDSEFLGQSFIRAYDPEISNTTIAVESANQTMLVPFGLFDAGDLLVSNITTGQSLSANVDYAITAAVPAGAANAKVTLLGSANTSVGDLIRMRVIRPITTYFGNASLNRVWIRIGTRVEVGAFYRTEDRCFTLDDFSSTPSGDLNLGRSVSSLSDGTYNERGFLDSNTNLPRVFRVIDTVATAPSEIHFAYKPTVFRTELALGQSLSAENPNLQLTPDLCEGAVLRVGEIGPGELEGFTRVGAPADGTAVGNPVRWDQVGKKLFPVHPGSYQLSWPDQNDPSKSYKIEVVAGYPDATVNLASERENPDGSRQTTAGSDNLLGTADDQYVTTATLDPVSIDFPGTAPGGIDAHYRYLYDPNPQRQAPTKLDLFAADQWHFKEMPFTDRTTNALVDAATTGTPFRAQGEGRCVLLYSYRPNPDEIADGNAAEENLAVRVIRSEQKAPILPDNQKMVLGRKGLELDGSRNLGIIRRGAATTTTINPGNNFVLDFWMNAGGLQTDDGEVTILATGNDHLKVTLDNNLALTETTLTSETQTITTPFSFSSAGEIRVSNLSTGAVLDSASDYNAVPGSPAGSLTLVDTNLTSVGDTIRVETATPRAPAPTISVTYRGIKVSHDFSTRGSDWRHYIIHIFEDRFIGTSLTMVDFYVDGIREEQGALSSALSESTATSTVGQTVNQSSLRFGVGADPDSKLQLDQIRLYPLAATTTSERTGTIPWLRPGEIRTLRTERGASLRSNAPEVWFNFENTPDADSSGTGVISFAAGNNSNQALLGIGPIASDPTGSYSDTWARLDIQEVATRLDSTLDNAGFDGTGYMLNSNSNYNAAIHNRNAEVGSWGPIFPVNDGRLYTGADKKLEVAYYENPFRTDEFQHPNVAWPYEAAQYNEVIFPTHGPHKNNAIYIASRLGSEGVDKTGHLQSAYDLDKYSDFSIYNQPQTTTAGYNPNEEHAIAAGSNRAALKFKEAGAEIANNPPLAAFALQKDINITSGPNYTSAPWTLTQFQNLSTGEWEMAAYEIFKTRTGAISFPRPPDTLVNTTDGLSYESAAAPEDRFLSMTPGVAIEFSYQFSFTAAAGDLLIPPYPLNLVIGNVAMADARGGNVGGKRALWRDVNRTAWVVSGGGEFFHQFFYPLRPDFYLQGATNGTPIAWVPDGGTTFTGDNEANAETPDDSPKPRKVSYTTFWRSDYPKLKRGETLTYQGGEYFNETPGSNGLPALVAMAAAEIVYDDSTPSMVITDSNVANYSARIIRPLDRREARFTVAEMSGVGFSPASPSILVVAERWYFSALAGSLQNRFYYDSLAEKLVFRGYLNGKDSGDPDLTAGPDPINTLEPNILTTDDITALKALSTDSAWTAKIDAIKGLSNAPHPVRYLTGTTPTSREAGPYYAGVRETASTTLIADTALTPDETASLNLQKTIEAELAIQWTASGTGENRTHTKNTNVTAGTFTHLNSFGAGAALVPNATLLTAPPQSTYITIAENNRSELDGAPISLHIIQIIPDRYRGAIKVIESADPFSEKVTLQHNGEFGANTKDLYYEWWIRDAAPLGVINNPADREIRPDGSLKESDPTTGQSLWQQYLPKARAEDSDLNENEKRLGNHTIVFEGRPDVTLADKLVLMRYRHKTESNWTLVPFEFTDATTAWKPGNIAPTTNAPFQWAGAANSPQIQASGEKLYIPQLVMGWVKRVLDRINPYEARYTDFFSNESPALYSSQIQIAGGPFAGKVALNPDKRVIENVGLIELYETVLARAKELSIDNSSNPVSTDGINQAILLAATRLAVLYELLAREAYSDAQDSTIAVDDGDGGWMTNVAPSVHAFENFEATLLHEELSLLRGTDFRKSYPVFNRMFWNFAKGLGEAAYTVNYNIYDENTDGFINEDDARALYPQGHGDAWGHFLSALGMHYELLQQPVFRWNSRSELYSIMQNVLEVDYLDEQTFAKLAAGKAIAGRDIVRNTYRLNYTQDPDGQWQGYTDGNDPARAWGVSEWSHRAGQGAYFDWAVANALLPLEASDGTPVPNPENLDRIERSTAESDIGTIAGGLLEIQNAMDEANNGVNPLGFDSNALSFAMNVEIALGLEASHFEQIHSRAVTAGQNALNTLEFASQSTNNLRRLADNTEELIVEALRQDLDYRNRLIEIFGRPYDGTIGFGKVYPEGYLGPDTMLYAYLDRIRISEIVPQLPAETDSRTANFNNIYVRETLGAMDNPVLVQLYNDVWTSTGTAGRNRREAFETLKGNNTYQLEAEVGNLSVPYDTASEYGFKPPADGSWGQRTSYGTVQTALEEMLTAEIALDQAVIDYIGFIQDWEVKTDRLVSELEIFNQTESLRDDIDQVRKDVNGTFVAIETILGIWDVVDTFTGDIAKGVKEALPTSIGFSNDVLAPARGAALLAATASRTPLNFVTKVKDIAKLIAEFARDEEIADTERGITRIEKLSEFEGMVEELVNLSGSDQPKRDTIGLAAQELELAKHRFKTATAEGFRLLRERESFNKVLAASVQKNRYQDMIFRLARNEAMAKYQSTFRHAARYTWLAARAYDYETSLDPGHPAAPTTIFDSIVRERQLGLWTEGEPSIGQGGLAEILAQLKGNFNVLKGQLGIMTPQIENGEMSLRSELFRIGPGPSEDEDGTPTGSAASDERWQNALKARIVTDISALPEFARHCRPFASRSDGPQPALVIPFSSHIEPGRNFFGRPLGPGDHSFSTANFATKMRGVGVWLVDYTDAGLAAAPRGYLIPSGNDYLRTSSAPEPITRTWTIHEQRVPTPFVINQSNLNDPGFIPSLNGVDGEFGSLNRHGDFRMYGYAANDNGFLGQFDAGMDAISFDTRLMGRSVWNSQWHLIIPGKALHPDGLTGLNRLIENISDIKLHFVTYSHQGQ